MKTELRSFNLIALIALALLLTPGCRDKKNETAPAPTADAGGDTQARTESGGDTQVRTATGGGTQVRTAGGGVQARTATDGGTQVRTDAANGGSKTLEATRSTSFSYWLIQNGCSTEKQTFDSKEALCKGLQDRSANKNCALELRQEKFKNDGCPGEFSETAGIVAQDHSGPSPVRCVGRVSGDSGEKKIDQTIPWDRKAYQKVVLSSFTDLKDAGEYSVQLLPHEDPNEVGGIRIFGWFIDNNKNQIIEGRLDSGVRFYHKDERLNGREVEIECGLVKQDLVPPVDSSEEKLKMSCVGNVGPIQGKKTGIFASFGWDRRSQLNEELKMTTDDGQTVTSGMQVMMAVNEQTGLPTMKVVGGAIDGHVEMMGEVQGRPELEVDYMSAWDHRHVKIHCMSGKAWQESIDKIAKAVRDGKIK